jgi:hypothetical protein
LHVFEFVMVESLIPVTDDDDADDDIDSKANAKDDDSESDSTNGSAQTTTDLQLVRRGSSRANVPLSAYRRTHEEIVVDQAVNATYVAEHLLAAFRYAAEIIPVQFHATTIVKYQATAGMRLLSVPEQDVVYDALYTGLTAQHDFVFSAMQRHDIATLPGDLEGFYGAVAANYLKGTIDADLQMISLETVKAKAAAKAKNVEQSSHENEEEHHHHHGPIGALDMGGSSTQIVFLPGMQPQQQQQQDDATCAAVEEDPLHTKDGSESSSTTCHTATLAELPSRLNGQDFFATSYLSYGVDQFRTRLWNTWVQEHAAAAALTPQTAAQNCDSKRIDNPCTFKGYEIEWEGYTLVGTGDAHECVLQVQRLIPHPNESATATGTSTSTTVDDSNDNSDEQDSSSDDDNEDDNDADNNNTHKLGKHVGGVQHPPVRGKFFAMSLYFFTLDSLRTLSHPDQEAWAALNLSWPTPSIAELYNALDGLCSRSWQGDLEEIQHEAHAYTRPEVLPHRCLESVYMVTLLRDGFGFAPESRDITFTFLVDGSEVEWSLGMALVLRAEQNTAGSENDVTGTAHDGKKNKDDAPSADGSRSDSNATYRQSSRKDPISGLYEEMTHQLFAAAS